MNPITTNRFYSLVLLTYNVFPGLPVVLPAQTEAVLVGAAILGACASQDYSSIQVITPTHRQISTIFSKC